jgi:hypothetical protein
VRRTIPVRVAIIGALVISPLIAIMASQGVAWAAADVLCTTANVGITGSGTISGCNDAANTGGSGTIKATLSKKTAVITWNGTGTTTTKYTYKGVADTCPKVGKDKIVEYKETTTVTGGTGTAATSIKKGNVGTTLLCYNETTKKISLKGDLEV